MSVVLKNSLTSILLQVALQASKLGISLPFITFNFNFCFSEDDDFKFSVGCDELFDESLLGCEVFAKHDFVADSIRHLNGIFSNQVKHDRILHIPSGNFLNICGYRSRENHGLGLRHEPLDFNDVLLETHVEHLVSFVKDLIFGSFDI